MNGNPSSFRVQGVVFMHMRISSIEQHRSTIEATSQRHPLEATSERHQSAIAARSERRRCRMSGMPFSAYTVLCTHVLSVEDTERLALINNFRVVHAMNMIETPFAYARGSVSTIRHHDNDIHLKVHEPAFSIP